MSVPSEILFAIVEIRMEAFAHFDTELRCHSQVTSVEERVSITSEQKAVIYSVFTLLGVRSNVSRFQHRQHLFAGNGAAPFVGVGHHHSK